MEEDIRRKGMLYLHQQRFGKKWRKVWCVLVAEGRRSVARLELYEYKQASIKEGSSKRKSDYKRVIRLRECIRISEHETNDRPKDCTTFLLETSDKVYMFAAHNLEVKDWINTLCEQAFPDLQERLPRQGSVYSEPVSSYQSKEMLENSLYDTADSVREFPVIAMGTDAAVRCNLYGEYLIFPQSECLLLKHHKTKEVLFKWPYCYVRKFGQDALSFSFEAGRRCESGEGNFEFATNQGERLFSIVSAAIQNLPKISSAKPRNLEHLDQRTFQDPVAMEELYDDTECHKPSDCLPKDSVQGAIQRQYPVKTFNPVSRGLSLPAIKLQSEDQMSSPDTNSEIQEPVYATVSKSQPQPTSPSDSKMHWENLRKALHHSFKTDNNVSQFPAFADPQEEGDRGETLTGVDLTDELSDSIQQLAINDALKNISAEAIYADPQDYHSGAEWDIGAVYDDPEEVIMGNQRAHDRAGHQSEHDPYSHDAVSTQAMVAPSNHDDDPAIFSAYDNFRLKGRQL